MALRFGCELRRASSSVAPPPIEWPMAPRRFGSTRLRTADGLEFFSQLRAALSWVARDSGLSKPLNGSSVITTNPFDARKGPVQAMNDSGDTNPGMTAMAAKVPWLVSFG